MHKKRVESQEFKMAIYVDYTEGNLGVFVI